MITSLFVLTGAIGAMVIVCRWCLRQERYDLPPRTEDEQTERVIEESVW